MSTELQKKLAQAIVANAKAKRPKNKKELLVSAGYDLTTAEATPSRTIEQKGVKDELLSLGFTEDKAKEVVTELLSDSKQEGNVRLKAADMVFKVYGTYAAEKSFSVSTNIGAEDLKALINEDIARFRGKGNTA